LAALLPAATTGGLNAAWPDNVLVVVVAPAAVVVTVEVAVLAIVAVLTAPCPLPAVGLATPACALDCDAEDSLVVNVSAFMVVVEAEASCAAPLADVDPVSRAVFDWGRKDATPTSRSARASPPTAPETKPPPFMPAVI
jgi:hypothetical protein